jgi:hypothetical protein
MHSHRTSSPLTSELLPPHDKEAERAILSAVLVRGSIPDSALGLESGDFYVSVHAYIWAAMRRVCAEGTLLDTVSVPRAFQSADTSMTTERVIAELVHLLDQRSIPENIPFYVQVIRERAVLRRTIQIASDIAAGSAQGQPDFPALLLMAEKQCLALRAASDNLGPVGFRLKSWDLSVGALESDAKVDWLIEPLVAPPDLISLVGDGGVGKSKLAAAAALAVGFEKPLWGNFQVKRAGKVIYLNEERPDITRQHLHSLAPSMDVDSDDIENRIKVLSGESKCWRVTDPNARKALVRSATGMGDAALIIWDSLHVLHDQDENDNSQMTATIDAFRRICSEIGCCGLLLHHTSKGQLGERHTSARGASAIKDTVDGQFLVRRAKDDVPGELKVVHDKTRRSLLDPFLIRLDHNEWGDPTEVSCLGNAPTRADGALEAVLEMIGASTKAVASGEFILGLGKRFGKQIVYDTLEQVREQNLAPWRKGARGAYFYGGEDEPSGE